MKLTHEEQSVFSRAQRKAYQCGRMTEAQARKILRKKEQDALLYSVIDELGNRDIKLFVDTDLNEINDAITKETLIQVAELLLSHKHLYKMRMHDMTAESYHPYQLPDPDTKLIDALKDLRTDIINPRQIHLAIYQTAKLLAVSNVLELRVTKLIDDHIDMLEQFNVENRHIIMNIVMGDKLSTSIHDLSNDLTWNCDLTFKEFCELDSRLTEMLMLSYKAKEMRITANLLANDIFRIPGRKIITLTSTNHSSFDIDNDKVTNTEPINFINLLAISMFTQGGLIVRQFLDTKYEALNGYGKMMTFPHKNIYGCEINEGTYNWLFEDVVFEVCNMDSRTGKILEKERGVEYCNYTF